MTDPNEDTFTADPNQIVYDKDHPVDHEVNVVKLFFAKLIPKFIIEKKEASYPVKNGGTPADVVKQFEKPGRSNFTTDKNPGTQLAPREEVKVRWDEKVQVKDANGKPVLEPELINKTIVKKKIVVAAVCEGITGTLTVQLFENKLGNTESVYANPVKFLIGEEEKDALVFKINGSKFYYQEITLRPKSDADFKGLIKKFATRTEKNAFLYLKGEVTETQDKVIFPDETHEFLNTDNNRLEVIGTPCYCNRDITVDEMLELIYHLRDSQNYKSKREHFFNGGSEKISAITINSGKLSDHMDRIKLFTDEMNTMFTKFNVNTCKRKIHFIGQMYLETISFTSTFESRSSVPDNYKGGVAFQGRGMKQITHDYNYLAYYDYVNGTSKSDIYMRYRSGYEGVGEFITNRKKAAENGIDQAFYETLKVFGKNISENLFHAFNSAGWFSTIYRKDTVAAMDGGLTDADVEKVTRAINGGLTDIDFRKNYTKWTKEFFKYDTECVNK